MLDVIAVVLFWRDFVPVGTDLRSVIFVWGSAAICQSISKMHAIPFSDCYDNGKCGIPANILRICTRNTSNTNRTATLSSNAGMSGI